MQKARGLNTKLKRKIIQENLVDNTKTVIKTSTFNLLATTTVLKVAQTSKPAPFHVAQNTIMYPKYALPAGWKLRFSFRTLNRVFNKRDHFIIPRWKAGRRIWENILKAFRFNIVSALKCICEGERWMNNTLLRGISHYQHRVQSAHCSFSSAYVSEDEWTVNSVYSTVRLVLSTPLSNLTLLIAVNLKSRSLNHKIFKPNVFTSSEC